jgi:tetratricopeptide (TPR) repeat protein
MRCRIQNSGLIAVVVLAIVELEGQEATHAVSEAATLRARAYELAYNLDHDEAIATLRQAITADPGDPASYRAMAAITWLHITIFERGSATVDDYVERVTQSNVRAKPPTPGQAALFHENADRALELAERRVAGNPSDPSAHYELGATVGVRASYQAVIDGRLLGAFRYARRAFNAHETVLRLDPNRADAGLIVGSYRYVISSMSLPMRWMAYVAGFGGGRERGLQMVEKAAAAGSDAQTDARFFLVLLYSREKRYDDALTTIRTLQRQYPRNRLLWLNEGATALRAGRAQMADESLSIGIAKLETDRRPRVFGEDALWRYKRGAARVALGRTESARADLEQARQGPARDWVRGRIHLELGKLADLAGDRARARMDYDQAMRYCKADNDPEGVTQAQRYRETPYRR